MKNTKLSEELNGFELAEHKALVEEGMNESAKSIVNTFNARHHKCAIQLFLDSMGREVILILGETLPRVRGLNRARLCPKRMKVCLSE